MVGTVLLPGMTFSAAALQTSPERTVRKEFGAKVSHALKLRPVWMSLLAMSVSTVLGI